MLVGKTCALFEGIETRDAILDCLELQQNLSAQYDVQNELLNNELVLHSAQIMNSVLPQ